MSVRKQIVEISPEALMGREAFAVGPMECPCCKGRGGSGNPFKPESEAWEECRQCEGSGEVIAFVNIDWRPNKSNRE